MGLIIGEFFGYTRAMNVLVTGGAGYIGSVVTAMLVHEGHEVTVVDDLSRGTQEAVAEGARFVRGDLMDPAVALRAAKSADFEAVLHFAARIEVGESAKEPALYMKHNVCTAANVLEAVRTAGVPRVIVSSTAAVYGNPERVPIEETMMPVPVNAYGASKLAMDQMLRFSAAAHGFAAVSLRYFNVAGAYRVRGAKGGEVWFGERHGPETHLIPNLLRAARNGRKTAQGEAAVPFQLFGDDYDTPDGTCVRDYVHVEDLARAHVLALEDVDEADRVVRPGEHRIYNIGSGEGFSVREVLEAARRVTGAAIPEVVRPRRAGDPARLVASSVRIRGELGWKPARTTLDAMIEDAWAFMQAGAGR